MTGNLRVTLRDVVGIKDLGFLEEFPIVLYFLDERYVNNEVIVKFRSSTYDDSFKYYDSLLKLINNKGLKIINAEFIEHNVDKEKIPKSVKKSIDYIDKSVI